MEVRRAGDAEGRAPAVEVVAQCNQGLKEALAALVAGCDELAKLDEWEERRLQNDGRATERAVRPWRSLWKPSRRWRIGRARREISVISPGRPRLL